MHTLGKWLTVLTLLNGSRRMLAQMERGMDWSSSLLKFALLLISYYFFLVSLFPSLFLSLSHTHAVILYCVSRKAPTIQFHLQVVIQIVSKFPVVILQKMNHENQGSNSAALSTVLPMKRGRGRPRKYDTPYEREEARRRRRRRTDSTSNGDQVLVGQMVSGVLDGSFDAGYLLTVRVGQTDTVLRGLVFKPGLSVPLSPANDVAPHAKMFTRSEVPLPVIQQQNLVPVLAPAPQMQNGWPVMILPINMSALPLDFQAGTVVSIQQVDGNPHPVVGALEDVNRAYQVAAQPLQLEIKTENITSSSAEGLQDAVDLGGLVSSHADQPPQRGKSANASPKEAVVGKGEPSSPTAAQKLESGLKNEIPFVIPVAMAHASGLCSDVTQAPSALPKTEKPVETLQETKEALSGTATQKHLKEKKKAPPDGRADDDRQATALAGGHNKHTLHLGLAHAGYENSHLTMGIREDQQTDKQVQMLVGQSRPVEPSDLQPPAVVDRGAFDGWASKSGGLPP